MRVEYWKKRGLCAEPRKDHDRFGWVDSRYPYYEAAGSVLESVNMNTLLR